MPFYTYHCPQCGRDFDARSAVAERDAQTCDGTRSTECSATPEEPAKLKREEIPEGGQRMGYNWSKWSM